MGMINPTARRDGGLSSPDGRSLAYAEWGTSSGPPVLLFHGGPGSRLFCPDYEATMSSGVRLITIDRPGFGGSDPHPGRTLLGWADDVAGLADALHLDRFAVIGFSSGGPHALVCAVALEERVNFVGTAAGAGASFDEAPHLYDDEDTALALIAREDLDRAAVIAMSDEWVNTMAQAPESLFQEDLTPEGDMWLFSDGETLEEFEEVIRVGMRQGPIGLAWDDIALDAPWGFKLENIRLPTNIWHGEQDLLESSEAVDFAAERIANCTVTTWPQDGHLGVMTHWSDVLAAAISGA
jgi:pimeloyl-ACP methyl ester carboxylesterase